jgi:hypothetical protein
MSNVEGVVIGSATSKIEWGPIIAGTLVAASLAFILHGFATAVGISVSSSAPTWRDASFALVFLSGLYLLLVAFASYALGSYVAVRMRTPIGAAQSSVSAYGDGIHGLLVWALATLLAAVMGFAIATLTPRLAVPSGAASGPTTSVVGENIVAYDLDRLFRGDRRTQAEIAYPRSEAARILMTASSHRGILPEDHAYLVRMVSASTGIAAPEAERRVNDVITRAKQNIDRARASVAILAFMAAASALVGAAVAWFAATAGGRQREGLDPIPEVWDWDKTYRQK